MEKRKLRNCMLASTMFSLTSGLHCSAQYAPDYRAASPPANSSTMASLEQQLNAVDSRSGWARTPVSGYTQGQTATPRGPRSPAPGTALNAVQGMFPGVSRQEMMRVFFEGGSPQMGGSMSGASAPSAASSANTSTAYSNYQTARNEETKARNNASKARYEKDKWNRKDDANQAEYAANNAEYAAQRAESAAYSGDSQARSYARLARESANRARYYANQARYNANTG
jgi:hypothetical protein